MIQRISSRGRGAPCLNIAGIHVAERRTRKKLLLGRIKPRNSKKCNVRLTHQRRLAQNRTSSGAPLPIMCATTMPSIRPEGVVAGVFKSASRSNHKRLMCL